MNKYNDGESKILDSIFETIVRHSSTTVKTLVNERTINILTSYTIPFRIEISTGEHALIINNFIASTYTPLNCNSFKDLSNNSNWHMIGIYHENVFSKDDILNELFEIADDVFFVPIAYRRNDNLDYFFINRQNEMIKKLIDKNLTIQIGEYILPMMIKTDVSNAVDGHPKPIKSILSLVLRKVNVSDHTTLDFSNISSEKEMTEVHVSLRNTQSLNIFLTQLNQVRNLKASIRMLKFDDNKISSLEPFATKLFGFSSLSILSLNRNSLKDINELQYLKHLNLDEINIERNFGVQTTKAFIIKYEKKVQELLPTLKKVNGVVLTNAVHQNIEILKRGNNEIANVGDGVLVNSANIKKHKFRKILKDYCWTKVTFTHNKRFSANEIIKHLTSTILRDVYFFPCYFKRVGDRDEFFLYKNPEALEKLFNSGLKIQMPSENFIASRNSFPIEISFNFNVADYNDDEIFWYTKIISAISGSIIDNVLNLNSFPQRREFTKILIPMTIATMELILTQARKINPNIVRIDAENCELTNCECFEGIYTFPKLTAINLRNNKIATLHGIKNCSEITEIFLDNNPVCNRPMSEYIAHITDYMPKVKFIDGLKLNDHRTSVNFQNFLVRRESHPIVEFFIQQFFETWDSFERLKLMEMYGQNSVFTLSIHYEHNSSVSFTQLYPRVQALISVGRNLTKISNMNQVVENVYCGSKEIGVVFGKLLKTKHRMQNLTVDVPLYDPQNRRILIVVGGVYDEFEGDSSSKSLPFAFSRTFLIKTSIEGEMKILNDQIVINGPTEGQINAMKNVEAVSEKDLKSLCEMLGPSEAEEKAMKVLMLQELTKCSKEYCQKLLKESFYDFKVALACFTTYMDSNQVSDDKFNFN